MTRILAVAASLLSFSLIAFASDDVLVTLKLAKVAGAPAILPVTLAFPADCKSCQQVADPAYYRQNAREVILAMRVPTSKSLQLRVMTRARYFRRVLLETTDLPFTTDANEIRFTLPGQIADRVDSGEFQTHLYWQGIELRFEHADPERRSGDYATGEFPMVQRGAAANLEFGLLQAIQQLGLGHYVDDQNLGRLFLMGFDTNYPHGHKDSPPHMHLVLWLPNYRATGSMIPHFYLTPDGLISHSLVMPYGIPAPAQNYPRGEPYAVVDNLGRPMLTLTITQDGWLNLSRFDGVMCSLVPVGHGFDSGVKVTCPNSSTHSLFVADDLQLGEIKERIDGKITSVFHYDLDNGVLLNPPDANCSTVNTQATHAEK
ncbi:MAG TPA: hypothetical protein VMI06_10650 [Terriglobia bacterium]|nr:hypothetical protein [Terriglobia bacterium]